MSLVDRHVAFVEALREAGMPVSLTEDLDAVRAVTRLGLADREALRAGLAATLVKRQSHRPGFDELLPYVVVDVELDEQPDLRMVARLLDGADAPLHVGARVTTAFEEIAPGSFLPAFVLDAS